MYPRARDCGWRDELRRVHQLGGDTVVQFAPQLSHRSIDVQGRVLRFGGTEPDPIFTACLDGGQTCYRAANAALRALHPDNRIVDTYAYATADAVTDGLITCARTEKRIAVPIDENGVQRTRLYWRLFLPRAAPQQTGCSTAAAQYDLVLVAGDAANSLGTLLAEVDAYGMRVYAPMPAFPSTDGRNSNVDNARTFSMLGNLTGHVPADLRAALLHMLGYLPGLTVTQETMASDGRTAVTLGYELDHGLYRNEILIDPDHGTRGRMAQRGSQAVPRFPTQASHHLGPAHRRGGRQARPAAVILRAHRATDGTT